MELEEEGQSDLGLFIDCVFVLDFDPTVTFKEKKRWREIITTRGGTLSYIVTRQVTYVVLVKDVIPASCLRQRQASRYNIPVVSKAYLEDCLSCSHRLSPQKYLIQREEKVKDFTRGKITTNVKKSATQKQRKPVTLSSVRSWHLDDADSPIPNNDHYDLAKWSILKHDTKLQVLEIHSIQSGQYRLYSQPGEITQGKHLTPLEDPVVWYFDDVLDVISGFQQLYKLYQAAPNHMSPWKNPRFTSNQIGSNKLKLLLSEQCIFGSNVSTEVGQFVELLWREAVQETEEILTIPIQHIKKEKVEEAECLLQQIKEEVTSHTVTGSNKVNGLLEKLYKDVLPHKEKYRKSDITARDVTAKLDLCQLIKDLHEVSEATDWSTSASTAAKFWALRCHVTCLDQSHEEFNQIKNLILESSVGVEILAVYEVRRAVEDIRFSREIGNKKLLMHSSSPSNFLGILSRGLLLPNIVVSEYGVGRTDGGKLGCGIYFSDSASTCIQYSVPTRNGFCRLLLVCEVALGNVFRTEKIDSKLTAPPSGYQSVLGIKQGEATKNSDFMDDEYVIYAPCQQRIRYVVQYRLHGDPPVGGALSELVISDEGEEEEIAEACDKIDISDVKDIPDPLTKVQTGLSRKKNQSVPLKGVHVRSNYWTWLLSGGVNISTGKVKEKEKAHKEYKEAISKGHGAYLMDEEEPDVFTVSVGNLPSKSDVLIKITYISELEVDGDNIVFCLPSRIAPWVKDTALAQQTQEELASVKVKDTQHLDTTVHVSVEMPFEIRKIFSPSHQLKIKKTATKAVLEIPKNSSLDDGFKLLVTLAEIHVPRMWIEEHAEHRSTACMLAFYPEFECSLIDHPQVLILLDMSNSMKDQASVDAKKVALLTLEKLPPETEFNVTIFGTTHQELFHTSQRATKDNVNKAIQFVQDVRPVLGCSNVFLPLTSVFLLTPPGGITNVLLVSDGHINHGRQLLQSVAENSSKIRIFSLTVGPSPNHHLMRSLAARGGGVSCCFDGKSKSTWESQIDSVIDKVNQWGIQGVKVEWQQHSDNLPAPVQAPAHVTSIFNGSRIVVYGFVNNCSQAKLKALVEGYNFETVVSSSELSMTQGEMLHQLTARAVIRDYDEGILNDNFILQKLEKQNKKDYIIELSKKFSIVTQYTSFVAIEERNEEDERLDSESVEKLLGEESVDILPYVGWTIPDNWEEKNTVEIVTSLLRQGEIAEGFSQSEAERCYLSVLQYADDIKQDENLQDLVW
ncbi:hypothetical protein FSP39_000300 [Pinctada imbricata]|uniref:Poly [ADP-ribose] polymerase n=1 Tax=Pinctada imbricata TaxID=66713 RepID=A0AA88YVL2_PINIB|nr:hypothetical protein FSP39_000300 [Pinctada imbricata]